MYSNMSSWEEEIRTPVPVQVQTATRPGAGRRESVVVVWAGGGAGRPRPSGPPPACRRPTACRGAADIAVANRRCARPWRGGRTILLFHINYFGNRH